MTTLRHTILRTPEPPAACQARSVPRAVLPRAVLVILITLTTGTRVLHAADAAGPPAFPVHRAVQHGDVVTLRVLLRADPTAVNAADPDGVTPLFVGAFLGRTDVVRFLLENGAQVDARTAVDGSTPLSIAAFRGHLEIVQLLVERGADLEAALSTDGATPYLLAASNST